MVVRGILATGVCLVAGACLGFDAYLCGSDDACRSRGEQGICQPSRYCSYPDTTCESGQRYDEFGGGGLADQCVQPTDEGTSSGTGINSSEGGESSDGANGTGSTSTGDPIPECGNEVLDPGEDCDDGNAVDGDGCNVDCTESGGVLWDVVHPELGSVARGVGVGPDGSVAVAGGRVENMQSDVLVLLFDPAGVAQWQRVHASAADGRDEGRQVVFDDAGNVYVTGYETLDTLMPTQRENAWTGVYGPKGAPAWTVGYNSAANANDRAYDIAWRGEEVIVAGRGGPDTWVEAYDIVDGQVRWTFADGIDPTVSDLANSVVAGADGIFCAGQIDNADGGIDAWFGRFTSAGAVGMIDWVEVVDPGGIDDDAALGIDLAADGGLVVGGRRGGLAWIAKYDGSGELQWERFDESLETPADVRGVAIDSAGQVVAVGYETDPVQGEDAFVTKYDADGTMVWSRRYDGPAGGTDRARAVAVAPDRTIAVSGFTDAADGRRLWLRKYSP